MVGLKTGKPRFSQKPLGGGSVMAAWRDISPEQTKPTSVQSIDICPAEIGISFLADFSG